MKILLSGLLALALGVTALRADENLVVNGTFDRDIGGWGGGALRDFYWDPRDAGQSLASGSLAVTADGEEGEVYAGCFAPPTHFGSRYVFEADVRFPGGPQSVPVGAVTLVFQWSSPSYLATCGTPITGTSVSPTVRDGDAGWHHLRVLSPPVPDPGSSTLFPIIRVQERLGFPPSLLLIDNVRVYPAISADDFESGDLLYWYGQQGWPGPAQ
ncbi:MAG TPA: hypothetical protein VGP73_26325 [Thermoanaerobaculia bacterium]